MFLRNRSDICSGKTFGYLNGRVIALNSSRPCGHYSRGIWKRSFIYPVRSTVHTNPSRKRSFSKTLFKQEELERLFVFVRTGNILKTELLENDVTTIVIECDFYNRIPKLQLIVAFSNFSRVVWTENISLCVFRVRPFSNSSCCCSVEEKKKKK